MSKDLQYRNILSISSRAELRKWFIENATIESECWLNVRRGRPVDEDHLWYLDAVEEALCFGWIDSIFKKIDGVTYQRFSPRRKKSLWTELNKERVRRLERLGLMTDLGRAVLPRMGTRSFKVHHEVEKALKDARVWSKFRSFHPLYQRVRAYNANFYRVHLPQQYPGVIGNLIRQTAQGKMIGEWNDYGRLLD